MKKLFYLFLLPFAMLMSCNDDNDISPVDMTLTLSGVSVSNDTFYTVVGSDVTINNLTVKSIDGKNTDVVNVVYNLNGVPLIGTLGNPFEGTFSTENWLPGNYTLGISGNLLQVDASVQVFAVTFPLTIVESSEDLPADAQVLGTNSQTIRLQNN